MRRSIVAAAVAAALVLTTPGAAPAAGPGSPDPDQARVQANAQGAERALTTALELFEPRRMGARGADDRRPDLSLALRDLFVALPHLDAADQRTARGLLARPTDGASDPMGHGYTVRSKKKCGKKVCIHWVNETADAAPGKKWVKTNLKVMTKVWKSQIGKLGFRKPRGDKRRGGNGKLDVYLKDLAPLGAYGYCAPERRVKGRKWEASGYCVLDNDFAKSQYRRPPKESLRVTAAHEFFHAVQFGYDYAEDRWLMEATATWMEERFADDVNDNRQYLPYGQVGRPGEPLDLFNPEGFNQYGNWVFFEYLSSRFGRNIVKQIWNRAGEFRGAKKQYSTAAVKGALAGKRGGFTDVFRKFAAANVVPGRAYPEGGKWKPAPATASWTLTKSARKQSTTTQINHMASHSFAVQPGDGIKGKRWKLRVRVDGPDRKKAPAAMLVVKRKKGVDRIPVKLSKKGKGSKTIAFNGKSVKSVRVVVVNASTRFKCWQQVGNFTCQGLPRDDNAKFKVTVKAIKGKKGKK